jgi:hydrogenase assembly chaperone HypC/HupF
MCISIPGTVLSVDADGATVETDGRRRRASTMFLPDIAPGDRVWIEAGTIVERLDPAEAESIEAILTAARTRPA